MTYLHAAQAYARAGWDVFPLAPTSKGPMRGSRGVLDATRDADAIDRWWSGSPTSGIGLRIPSGVYVLDPDIRSGGMDLYRDLLARHGPMPITPTQITASGGLHVLLSDPAPRRKTKVIDGGRSIDLLGAGRYIVAAPTALRSGVYSWVCPFDTPVATMPAWLAEATVWIPPVGDRVRRARAWVEHADAALSGQGGHGTAMRVIERMVRGFGLTDEEAIHCLDGWNIRCQPPWSQEELLHKIRDGRRVGDTPIGSLYDAERNAESVEVIPTRSVTEVSVPGGGGILRGDHIELSDILRARIGPTTVVVDDDLWAYRDALWTRCDDREMVDIVAQFAGQPCGEQGKPLRIRSTDVSGIIRIAKDRMRVRDFFTGYRPGVQFVDKFVEVHGDVVRCVDPHPDHRQRVRLPYAYRDGAEPAHLLRFLNEVFKGDTDRDSKISMIQEFFGLCLVGLAARPAVAMLALGEGSNGKSVLARVMKEIMPAGTVSCVAPQDWSSAYSRAILEGKLLNVCSECPESDILSSASVKAILSGDPIEARHPYGRPFTFTPRAGHYYAANALPGSKDWSHGFMRRWAVITFNRTFKPGEGDPGLADRILEYRADIASWLIDGVRRYLSRGEVYDMPGSAVEARTVWREESDSVAGYIAERTAVSDTMMQVSTLYSDYRDWCAMSGMQPVSIKKFGARARTIHGISVHKSNGKMVYNLRLTGD